MILKQGKSDIQLAERASGKNILYAGLSEVNQDTVNTFHGSGNFKRKKDYITLQKHIQGKRNEILKKGNCTSSWKTVNLSRLFHSRFLV